MRSANSNWCFVCVVATLFHCESLFPFGVVARSPKLGGCCKQVRCSTFVLNQHLLIADHICTRCPFSKSRRFKFRQTGWIFCRPLHADGWRAVVVAHTGPLSNRCHSPHPLAVQPSHMVRVWLVGGVLASLFLGARSQGACARKCSRCSGSSAYASRIAAARRPCPLVFRVDCVVSMWRCA